MELKGENDLLRADNQAMERRLGCIELGAIKPIIGGRASL
jgi:hypothetical protein